MNTQNPAKWLSAGLFVLVVAATASYYLLTHYPLGPTTETTPAVTSRHAPATATTATAPQHPISQASVSPAQASTAALPTLDDSDGTVRDAMTQFGGPNASHLLVGKALIARIVATVNALPGKRLPPSLLPLHSPRGSFTVTQDHHATVMTATNAERYARYTEVLEKADSRQLAAWYVHNYPLFEQAWRQLGYPQQHFNDRLVQVIDLLLTTPTPAQPPHLQGGHGVYRFNDPQLENLAIGQKMLLRLGPQREAAAKAKLRALRAAVTGRTLPAPAASGSGD